MLFVTSEWGRDDIIKIDLNPGGDGNPHVVQILTKQQTATINTFLQQFPAVDVIQLADTVQVLQSDIEGFSMKRNGSETYLVADDDQTDGGNDVVDFRKFRDTEADYDGNHLMSIVDIDMLHARVVFGQGGGIPDTRYDQDNDGDVDADDGYYLVKNVMELWIGDANLDGLFNSADFVKVFDNGEYEDGIPLNSTWSEGDWNFDGDFTTGDQVDAFQDGGWSG